MYMPGSSMDISYEEMVVKRSPRAKGKRSSVAKAKRKNAAAKIDDVSDDSEEIRKELEDQGIYICLISSKTHKCNI